MFVIFKVIKNCNNQI